MLMILLSTLIRYLICGNNYDWLLNLNLIYKTPLAGVVSGLQFNAGKTRLVLFDRSNNTGAIDMKMDRSVLQEKSSLKMLGLTFSSILDWGSYIISIAKNVSNKIRVSFSLVALYLYKSTVYGHTWNTVVMSGLVLPGANWNCQISYKIRYAGLLPLHLLIPGSSSRCSQPKAFSIGITLVDVHLNCISWFHFLTLEGGLYGFKSRIKRHLLTVDSFFLNRFPVCCKGTLSGLRQFLATSLVIFYYLAKFHFWLPLLCEILGNMCVVIIC